MEQSHHIRYKITVLISNHNHLQNSNKQCRIYLHQLFYFRGVLFLVLFFALCILSFKLLHCIFIVLYFILSISFSYFYIQVHFWVNLCKSTIKLYYVLWSFWFSKWRVHISGQKRWSNVLVNLAWTMGPSAYPTISPDFNNISPC